MPSCSSNLRKVFCEESQERCATTRRSISRRRIGGGPDAPRSDAFEERARRQFDKRIVGAEVLVGWRSGSDGAATEGPPRAADISPEMRLTGLRAASPERSVRAAAGSKRTRPTYKR